MCRSFWWCIFFFVNREGNSHAHLLALWAALWNWSRAAPISCPPAIVSKKRWAREYYFISQTYFTGELGKTIVSKKKWCLFKKKKKKKELPFNGLMFNLLHLEISKFSLLLKRKSCLSPILVRRENYFMSQNSFNCRIWFNN